MGTLEGIRGAVADGVGGEVEHTLYEADDCELLDRLHSLDEGTTCAMVVGHNPLLSDLATWLVGGRGGAIVMKKAALASIEIPNPSPQPRGSLTWLLTPKSAG